MDDQDYVLGVIQCWKEFLYFKIGLVFTLYQSEPMKTSGDFSKET